MFHSQIKSNRNATSSKRLVGVDFTEGGLCSFLSLKERKLEEKTYMKKEFEYEIR